MINEYITDRLLDMKMDWPHHFKSRERVHAIAAADGWVYDVETDSYGPAPSR